MKPSLTVLIVILCVGASCVCALALCAFAVIMFGQDFPIITVRNHSSQELLLDVDGRKYRLSHDQSVRVKYPVNSLQLVVQTENGEGWRYTLGQPMKSRLDLQIEPDKRLFNLVTGPDDIDQLPPQPPGFPLVPFKE
jgi:hypothetical protein